MKNKYSFGDKIQLTYWLLKTKLIDRHARLFRFPIIIRGRKYIDFGNRLTTGVGCRFDVYPLCTKSDREITVKFGDDVQINDYVHVVGMESITIGDNVLMASHVFISDNSHGSYKGDEYDSEPNVAPIKREYRTAPISIGKNTWIGEGVIIMPGVAIGEGCVIGAHSIVNKDIPDFSVVVGSPIRVVKKYNFNLKRWEKV